MGIVYLAHDEAGRAVALKVMQPKLAASEEFRRRFRKEAEAAGRVARFCTAPVLDACLDGELAYLVTEYVERPDLAAVVEARGPMEGANLEALAVGVAVALTAIHGAEVIHRDLKPSNILLSPVGPRVIDFGIAQLAETLSTPTGGLIGTPAYMAPEHARGERVAAAADVFAWGGVVTYAGTGRAPFGSGSAPELLYRVANHAPRLDGLDDGLRALVERALDKDPSRRPTAQQLLDRLVGREEVGAEAATLIVSKIWDPPVTGVTASTPPVPPQLPPADRAPRRRSWWLPFAVAGLALAVAATVLVIQLPRTPSDTTSGQASNAPSQASSTPGQASTSRSVQVGETDVHVQIDSLVRQGTQVRLQLTVTNKGTTSLPLIQADVFGSLGVNLSKVRLTPPGAGKLYFPAGGFTACVCSDVTYQLIPGVSDRYYAVYTGVPEEIKVVDVDLHRLGVFTQVPISRA